MNCAERTCPGWCCAAFYLPRTPAQVRKMPGDVFDGQQIADMVIPLTPKEARERYERFSGQSAKGAYKWKHRGHHYTCKHWDEETRLCTIYDERPIMCRDFPYGKSCQFGCGYTGGVPTEQRAAIRFEQVQNQWKAYVSPDPPKELV